MNKGYLVMTSIEFLQSYYNDGDTFYTLLIDRKGDKIPQQYKNNTKDFKSLVERLEYYNKNGWDIYYSLNVYNVLNDKIERKKNYVKEIRTIFFDIDKDALEIGKKIVDSLGEPTYIIRTSNQKFQFLYMLLNPSKNIEECERVGEILSKHFDTDKTWDSPRVARLPNMTNNKNDFTVKVHKSSNRKFDLTHFTDYIEDNNLTLSKTQNTSKEKQVKNVINVINVKKNFTYEDKYNEFLARNGGNRSDADLSFIVWLKHQRRTKNPDKLIAHLKNIRGDELAEKPNLEDYLERLIRNAN